MATSGSGAPEPAPAQVDVTRLPLLARATLLVFLSFGTYVRVAGVWCQALYGDEEHAVRNLTASYAGILCYYDPVGSHVAFPILQRASMDLFGPSVFSYRLPAVIAGLLGLWLLYPLGRHLVGRGPAWLATTLLAVLPLHVYHSRFARAYALVFLLALVLLFNLVRALEGQRRAWIGVGLASALLPWVHLSTAAPVAALAVTSVALAWRQPSRPFLRDALSTYVAAAALALALFAPGVESLIESLQWLSSQRGKQGAALTDVLALLGGSAAGGWAIAIGSALAGILLARRGRPAGALFLTALVTPPVTVWLSKTIGAETAYARYQFIALVPLLLGSAWVFFELLGRIRAGLRGGPAYAAGLGLVSLQALLNPIPMGGLFGAFSNYKQWLVPEPGLARPFSSTPAIYHQLANSPRALTVVEFPFIPEATALFDNYQRQHRQHTLVGVTSRTEGIYARRPYVSLRELDLAASDVDCVIIHKDLKSEFERVLAEASPHYDMPTDAGLVVEERMMKRLHETWGEPTFEDEFVQAWMVAREPAAAGSPKDR